MMHDGAGDGNGKRTRAERDGAFAEGVEDAKLFSDVAGGERAAVGAFAGEDGVEIESHCGSLRN